MASCLEAVLDKGWTKVSCLEVALDWTCMIGSGPCLEGALEATLEAALETGLLVTTPVSSASSS